MTNELMTDPVSTVDGFTFERSAIEEWMRRHAPRSAKCNDIGALYWSDATGVCIPYGVCAGLVLGEQL